jgi:formate dehydrogenase maturation protein FdhE
MIDKDLSNVPDKISAIADAIQNGRNPQIERLLEDAIVRASSSISKTAKMDPLAPTPDWQHYAERLLTAKKEALERDLATATANLQMTRGEANNISITETTMRNDILNQEIEDSVEENTSSSKSTTSPRKKAADFESPFKQQSAQKFQELNEATSAITALKAEIDAVTEAIALGDFDAEVQTKAKAAHARVASSEPMAGPSSKREIAWDKFIIELLTIITVKDSLIATLHSTVNDLCSRLRFVDIAPGKDSDDRIRRLAQTSRAFDWVHAERANQTQGH